MCSNCLNVTKNRFFYLAESREISGIKETFLVRVCALHRPDSSWSPTYNQFCIQLQIFHGTRPITAALTTPYCTKTESFYDRFKFDTWLESKTLLVGNLPREARLVFTLIGRDQTRVNSSEGGTEVVYSYKNVGWASLQLFDSEL